MKALTGALVLLLITGVSSVAAQTFCNSAAITIPATGTSGVGTPYPSSITVSGVAGVVDRVSVNINGFSHTFPDDVDMLLVAPSGQKMIIQSDTNGNTDVAGINYVINDSASTALSDSGALTAGAYRPTDYSTGDIFTAPAPGGPYNDPATAGAATLASTFAGIDPNGTWQLYVVDDTSTDTGGISGGWCITIGPPPLKISEFRVRGPSGASDEYIELLNDSMADLIVASLDGTSGFAVAASDAASRCVVPNGTIIPPYSHYLCASSVAYSIGSYPAGSGTTATGSTTFITNINDNAGIAVFGTSNPANFTLAYRLDAVGSTTEASAIYKEGTGYSALTPFSIDYAFVRDACGHQGSITNFTNCPAGGFALDTDNNATDFVFVDTNGTSAGAGQRLGAPGPENQSSPQFGSGHLTVVPLDTCFVETASPNVERDFTSDPASNSTFGTIDVRFNVTNNTGSALTKLRFRVIDITTFPAPAGYADLRPRTVASLGVAVDRPPCGSGLSVATTEATTLEQPPSQPNGGGFNSSLSVGSITSGSPLADGASVNVRLLFGIQQTGTYKIVLVPEGAPVGGGLGELIAIYGCTDSCAAGDLIFKNGLDYY